MFIVRMADQKKVRPLGLIKNLKIDLVGYVCKILVIILNMENGIEAYSMLLGRQWLKQRKSHHNWGDNILTITPEDRTVTLNSIKRVNIKSSQRPKYLDNEFDWDEGFSEQEEEEMYKEVLEL